MADTWQMDHPPLANRAALTAAALFVACAVTANITTAHLGLVPVGFGLTVTAGTFAAGAALTARDLVHDTAGIRGVAACIAAGGLLSWVTSTPALAAASVAAFVLGELADLAVYGPLRHRSWQAAVWASLAAGAAVDSYVFLRLAGFPVGTTAVLGQLLGKAYATVPFSLARAGRTFTARRRAAT